MSKCPQSYFEEVVASFRLSRFRVDSESLAATRDTPYTFVLASHASHQRRVLASMDQYSIESLAENL
jgi:hypothetical protein